jgi:uncharacterized protein
MDGFAGRYGRYALVTGASRGIGAEFARQLAQRGLDLVLVARQADLLDKVAGALTADCGVDVRTIAVDLLREDAVDEILRHTESLDVGLLVSNAGMGTAGPFLRAAAQDHTDAALVNAIRPMQLAHALGQRLAAKRRGGIIFVTSMSGQLPAAYQASYGASKGYLAFLAQALRVELAEVGVDVTELSPGATDTDMLRSAPFEWDQLTALGVSQPAPVVTAALDALGKRSVVIPDRKVRAYNFVLQRLMPRAMAIRLNGRFVRRMLLDEGD